MTGIPNHHSLNTFKVFKKVRYLTILLLLPDGRTVWRDTCWGKRCIDEIKKEGTIVMMFVNQ
jgi:hypothetical protein